jgi:hypothetical protein
MPFQSDPSFAESRRLTESGQMPVEMLQAMSLRPELLRSFAGFWRFGLSRRVAGSVRQRAW